MALANQAEEKKLTDAEITAQHKHQEKILKQDALRKKKNTVSEEWVEIRRDSLHKKGGKVSIAKRMKNGNVHRMYLGREKQVSDIVGKLKARGIKSEFI